MPKQKTGGKDWEPGQSGNPRGRPRVPKELKGIKALSPNLLGKLITKYGGMDRDKLRLKAADPRTPALDLMIISIITKAIKDGDYTRLNFLLDRTIGKVKEVKELVLPQPTLIEKSDGAQVLLGAEMVETLTEDET